MRTPLVRRQPILPRSGFLPKLPTPPMSSSPEPSPTAPGTVSVIIPAYNAATTITDAIHSFLAQTRLPDEIVVVDDGSDDETSRVVSACHCANVEIVLVELDRNRGASAARNEGIRRACGEWLIFADADDLAPPDRVEVTLRDFVEGEDDGLAVIYGQKERFTHDFTKRTSAPLATSPTPRTVVSGCGFGSQALATRRDVHTGQGVWFDESMVVAEDAEVLVACLSKCVVVRCSPDVVCWQRISETSLTHRGDWGLMREWIMVKHRNWLRKYTGRDIPLSAEQIAQVRGRRTAAGWQ